MASKEIVGDPKIPPKKKNLIVKKLPAEIWFKIFEEFNPKPKFFYEMDDSDGDFDDLDVNKETLLSLARTCSTLNGLVMKYAEFYCNADRKLEKVKTLVADHASCSTFMFMNESAEEIEARLRGRLSLWHVNLINETLSRHPYLVCHCDEYDDWDEWDNGPEYTGAELLRDLFAF